MTCPQIISNFAMLGSGDQVVVLGRIKEQIIETLLIQDLLTPSSLQPEVFAEHVVAVRQLRVLMNERHA